MPESLEPSVREAFAADTRRLMARRVPLGVCFFVAVVATAGLVEWSYYPDRALALVTSFTAEMVLCAAAVLLSRSRALRRWLIPFTVAATLGIAACMTAYAVASGVSADALAFALVFFLPGIALLYPWGVGGQVALAAGTVAVFALALRVGLRGALPVPYPMIAVTGAALTSIAGARFLEVLRSANFRQRVQLERTRDAQMTRLYEVTRTITATLELHPVLQLVCQSVLDALGFERLWLFWRGTPEGDVRALQARLEAGKTGLTELSGDPAMWELLLDRGVTAAELYVPTGNEAIALGNGRPLAGPLLRLPLDFRSERIGIILGELRGHERSVDPSYLEFAATLANSAAMAIANARLHEIALNNRTQLQRLSKRGLAIVEDVMRRISRELHDNTCQALMAIKLDLTLLERKLGGPPEAVQDALHEIRTQIMRVMHDVREMSHLIRPPVLDELGAVAAIESAAAKYREAADLPVDVECSEPGVRFPAPIELLLFRIFQEAMMNIIRHASATHVTVRLALDNGAVRLEVEDDGRGFDAQAYFRRPPTSAGLGLLGMRERLGYYGGTFRITSRPGEGTVVMARVPVEPRLPATTAATA